MNTAEQFIKAKTARGGDEYDLYKDYDTIDGELELEKYIENHPKIIGDVYRGCTTDIINYEIDDIIFIPDIYSLSSFPSFTKNRLRAAIYMSDASLYSQEDGIKKVMFHVKLHGFYCIEISELSIYPEETECLFDENAMFRVLDVERKASYTLVTLEEYKKQ